jgi:hypothetical protein
MMAQVTGAATALVIWLAYVVIVECLTAVAVLLAEFIWHRVRSLRPLLSSTPEPAASQAHAQMASVIGDQGQPYRVGGGIKLWE